MAQFVVSAWASSSNLDATSVATNAGDERWSSTSADVWVSSTAGLPQWVRADLGTSQVATWYRVHPRVNVTDPSAWTFEGSDDASSWTVLDTRSGETWAGSTRTFEFSNSTPYRYYRLNATASPYGPAASVGELEIGSGDHHGVIFEHLSYSTSGASRTMGLVFVVNSAVEVTHLAYACTGISGSHSIAVRIRDDSGTVVASGTYSASSGETGWREQAITPVTLVPGTYMVEQYAGTIFAYRGGVFSPSVDYGPGGEVTVPANGTVTYRSLTATSRFVSGDADPTSAYSATSVAGFRFVPAAAGEGSTVEASGLLPVANIAGSVTVTGSIETSGLLPDVAIEGTFSVGAVLGQVDAAGLLPSADFDVDIVAGGEIGIDILLPTVEVNGDVITLGTVAGTGLLPTVETLGEAAATGTLEALGLLPTTDIAASITVTGEVTASGLLPTLYVTTSVLAPVYGDIDVDGLLPLLSLGGSTYIRNPVAESLHIPGKYAEPMTLSGLIAVTASQPSKIAVRNR